MSNELPHAAIDCPECGTPIRITLKKGRPPSKPVPCPKCKHPIPVTQDDIVHPGKKNAREHAPDILRETKQRDLLRATRLADFDPSNMPPEALPDPPTSEVDPPTAENDPPSVEVDPSLTAEHAAAPPPEAGRPSKTKDDDKKSSPAGFGIIRKRGERTKPRPERSDWMGDGVHIVKVGGERGRDEVFGRARASADHGVAIGRIRPKRVPANLVVDAEDPDLPAPVSETPAEADSVPPSTGADSVDESAITTSPDESAETPETTDDEAASVDEDAAPKKPKLSLGPAPKPRPPESTDDGDDADESEGESKAPKLNLAKLKSLKRKLDRLQKEREEDSEADLAEESDGDVRPEDEESIDLDFGLDSSDEELEIPDEFEEFDEPMLEFPSTPEEELLSEVSDASFEVGDVEVDEAEEIDLDAALQLDEPEEEEEVPSEEPHLGEELSIELSPDIESDATHIKAPSAGEGGDEDLEPRREDPKTKIMQPVDDSPSQPPIGLIVAVVVILVVVAIVGIALLGG